MFQVRIILLSIGISCTLKLVAQEKSRSFELGTELAINHHIKYIASIIKSKHRPSFGLNARINQNLHLAWFGQLKYLELKREDNWNTNKYECTQQLLRINLGFEYHWYRYGSEQAYHYSKDWTPFGTLGLGLMGDWSNNFQITPLLYIGFGLKYKINRKLQLIGSYNCYYGLEQKQTPQTKDLSAIKQGNTLRHGVLFGELNVGLSWKLWNNELNCR